MTDHSDDTWPSVTGNTVTGLTIFGPRPRWQRLLSWAVPSWRYPRRIFTWPTWPTDGVMFDDRDALVPVTPNGGDISTVKIQFSNEGFATFS